MKSLRLLIAVLLALAFLFQRGQTLSMPTAMPELTYTTGTVVLNTANWSITTPTSFVVNFQTTMSTSSLNATLGIIGISYYLKGSSWGWQMSIASVLQSSLTVLLNVVDKTNPIYNIKLCYFVTYNTLLDINTVTYTFLATDPVANFGAGINFCYIDCRKYNTTQLFTAKTAGIVLTMLSGFSVGGTGYSANSNTYFGITLDPIQPPTTGTASSFNMTITVYGGAELSSISYYYISFEPNTLNVVGYRLSTYGTNSAARMGCQYSSPSNDCSSGSPLSDTSLSTGKTGVMSYTQNNFFIGMSRLINQWSTGWASAQFSINNFNQNADSSIRVTFGFKNNQNNQRFHVGFSYFTLQTFYCPTTGVDIYMVYNSNMCDSSCNTTIQQFANATNFCQMCGPLCWTCITTSTTCTSCYNSQNRVVSGGLCVCDTAGGFYDDGSNICPQCNYTCKTCTGGSSTTCLSCNAAAFRTLITNSCPCNVGYYDNRASVCLPCHYTCATATCSSNANVDCLSCNAAKFRMQLADFTCGCMAEYYQSSATELCTPCHYSCATCWGSNTFCTSCSAANLRYLTTTGNDCLCSPGYYDPGVVLCVLCHTTCLTCNGPLNTNCLSCSLATSRTLVGSTCVCGLRLYDHNNVCVSCSYTCLTCTDATATSCTSCNSAAFRTIVADGTCPCNPGYYDAGAQICLPCAASCLTCISTSNMCTSCHNNPGRYFTGIGYGCLCSSGYVDTTFNGFCTLCSYSCLTCSGPLATNCVLCPSNRLQSGTSCLCLAGTYDNGVSVTCQPCSATCLTCNSGLPSSCMSCNSLQYRFLTPSPVGSCLCSPSYYDSGATTCQLCSPACLTCWGSASNCSSCDNTVDHRLISSNNNCVCASGYVDVGATVCSACVATCLTCAVLPNSCTSCSPDRVLTSGSCPCIAGKFQNSVTGTCDSCVPSCATCTGSASFCTSCPANSFRSFSANACPCVTGYMETGSTFCQPCSYTCASCVGLASVCASCPANSFRTFNSASGTCPCNAGYYDNGGSSICLLCGSSCLTCTLYSQCLTCDTTLLRTWDSVYLACPCNTGYYDAGAALCVACYPSCLTCSGVTSSSCITCPASRVLQGTSCICVLGTYDDGGSCVACSVSCLTCATSATICTSCSLGSFLSGGQCLCTAGFYLNGNVCSPCDSSCSSCSVTSTACTACNPSIGTVLSGSSCVCPSGLFKPVSPLNAICTECNFRCLTCATTAKSCLSCSAPNRRTINLATSTCDCDAGYFDNNTAICASCVTPCATCNGGSSLNCTSCSVGYTLIGSSCISTLPCGSYQYQGSCVSFCPNTTYVSGSSCVTCINNCLTCVSSLICTSCKPGFFMMSSTCLSTCPVGTYINASSQICTSCPSGCTQCTIYPSGLVCFSCSAGLSLINNSCSLCPADGTHVVVGPSCLPCLSPCGTCTALSSSGCITCIQGYNLLNSMCLKACPQGYSSVGGLCTPCNSNCSKCNSSGCIRCLSDFYLNPAGICIPSMFFIDRSGIQKSCHPNCLSCTDNSFSSCMTCSQNRGDSSGMAVSGYCECWIGFIQAGNGTCDGNSYKAIQSLTETLVTSTASVTFLSALAAVVSLNFQACGMTLFYQQTYSSFYYINSSAVLQTDAVLQRYGDSSLSHMAKGIDRKQYGRRLHSRYLATSSISNNYIQDDESLFMRGSQFQYLIEFAKIVALTTFSLWILLLILKFVVGRFKKKEGNFYNVSSKLNEFLNESALILLLILTFNEIALYGLASFKIVITKYSQALQPLLLSLSIFIFAYYILYLLRILVKTVLDAAPQQQKKLKILYACFQPSRLGRKACRAYLPLLLVRSLLFNIFIVILSLNPVLQVIFCMGAMILWDIYSFFACPYHFYIRVFVRIHELLFTLQIIMLAVGVVRAQYSRVGAATGLLVLNSMQIVLFICLSVSVILDRIYSIKCFRRNTNAVATNQPNQNGNVKTIEKANLDVQIQYKSMCNETMANFNQYPQKNERRGLKNQQIESFESILLQESNMQIPTNDAPVSIKKQPSQEIIKKRYRVKREKQ